MNSIRVIAERLLYAYTGNPDRHYKCASCKQDIAPHPGMEHLATCDWTLLRKALEATE